MASRETREIITIQVGHYSNFIGAHWWNIQEASFNYDPNGETDINHDYMFQEGVTPNRIPTYTPRLLSVDAKGSLNNLASFGTLYESNRTPSPLDAAWQGKIQVVNQLPHEKNEFLRDLERDDARFLKSIDEDKDICMDDCSDHSKSDRSDSPHKFYNLKRQVSVWSDFLSCHLHPKSIFTVNDLWHQQFTADNNQSHWGFSPGQQIMKKESNQEEMDDRIRLLAESCNSLQGFHLLFDSHNGMAGVGAAIAQHLADEFGSKDSLCFPIIPPHFNAANIDVSTHYLTSIVQCYTEMSNLTNLMVPLNLKNHPWSSWAPTVSNPLLNLDVSCAYETSSVFASFLDSISMSYRRKDSPLSLNHLVELLAVGGRKIAGGSFAFPLGLTSDSDFYTWLKNESKFNFMPMTSGCKINNEPITECCVIRGLDKRLYKPGTNVPHMVKFSSAALMYKQSLEDRATFNCVRHITSLKDSMKTSKTFPHIFPYQIDMDGFLNNENTSNSNVISLPSISGIHQGSDIGHMLQDIHNSGAEINVTRIAAIIEDGIDSESWAENLETLGHLIENYEIKKPEVESDED